jgi:hypothetical protein
MRCFVENKEQIQTGPIDLPPIERCKMVLAIAFRGLHHLPSGFKDHGRWIEANIFGGVATYDFDVLTRLVVAAHDLCVRVEISHSGPRLIKLILHPRQREGGMCHRHPTIEEAIKKVRESIE